MPLTSSPPRSSGGPLASTQPEHGASERRLARARLAHHAEDLPAAPLEGDAIEGPGHLPSLPERHRQVAHLHQGRVVGGAPPLPAELAYQRALLADDGDRVEQLTRVLVLRRGEHVGDPALLDDLPLVHHRDPVAGFGEDPEVVRDQDQGQAELAPQALEQLKDLRLRDDVERGGRLVGDHELRPARERERDHHPLALAPRELVRVAATQRGGQADRLQQPRRPLADVGGVGLVDPDRLGQLRVDLLHGVERVHRALEHQRDVPPAHVTHAGLRAAADVDRLVRARRAKRERAALLQTRREQPQQRQGGRRLPAARLAGEAEGLPGLELEGDIVDEVPAVRRDPQALDVEQRTRHQPAASRRRGLTCSSNR